MLDESVLRLCPLFFMRTLPCSPQILTFCSRSFRSFCYARLIIPESDRFWILCSVSHRGSRGWWRRMCTLFESFRGVCDGLYGSDVNYPSLRYLTRCRVHYVVFRVSDVASFDGREILGSAPCSLRIRMIQMERIGFLISVSCDSFHARGSVNCSSAVCCWVW